MARGDFPSSKQDQYMLRFPEGMRDRIKAAAEENNRSMNAEIVSRLEETFRVDIPAVYLTDQLRARQAGKDVGDEDLTVEGIVARELQRTLQKFSKNAVRQAMNHLANAGISISLEATRSPTLLEAAMERRLASSPAAAQSREEPEKADPRDSTDLLKLRDDTVLMLDLIRQELAGDIQGPEAHMATELGDELSEAIGKRTELAMRLVVKHLQENGFLKASDEASNEAVAEVQRKLLGPEATEASVLASHRARVARSMAGLRSSNDAVPPDSASKKKTNPR